MTILERSKEARASKALQDKVDERKDMKLLTETTIQEFRGKDKLESIVVKNLATGESSEMRPGAVFVFIGLLPNTGFV